MLMPLDQTLKTVALQPVLPRLTFRLIFCLSHTFYLFLTYGCAELLSSANLLANFLCTLSYKWSRLLKVLSPSRHLIQVQHVGSPICSLDIAGTEHVSTIFARIPLHLLMYRGAS